jgi:hypothetical protein
MRAIWSLGTFSEVFWGVETSMKSMQGIPEKKMTMKPMEEATFQSKYMTGAQVDYGYTVSACAGTYTLWDHWTLRFVYPIFSELALSPLRRVPSTWLTQSLRMQRHKQQLLLPLQTSPVW